MSNLPDPYTVELRKPPSKRRGSLEARLWRKVQIGSPGECWPFVGARTARGYGKIRDVGGIASKTLLAHRVAYAVSNGPIRPTDVILHSCDNTSCCNPSHLAKGTLSTNTQDMLAKGRHFTPWRGDGASQAKLSEKAVREIRSSTLSCLELARQYGISERTISRAKVGKTWRHVT